MDDFYLGTILAWPMKRVPLNFLVCDGSIQQIKSYQALFSLIGNTYGGDGKTTFKLPDLVLRTPIGVGTRSFPVGSSSSTTITMNLGDNAGSAYILLSIDNLPAHNHLVKINKLPITGTATGSFAPKCLNDTGDKSTPTSNVMAKINNGYVAPADADSEMASISGNFDITGTATGNVASEAIGSGMPFSNFQPSIGINWIICCSGLYPVFD